MIQGYVNSRNPILPPDIMIPDGEGHEFSDGRFYIYGSYDISPKQWCSEEYHVVSSPDLKTWDVSDKSFDGHDISFAIHGRKSYPTVDFNLRNPTPLMQKKGLKLPKFLLPEKFDIGKFSKNTYNLAAPDCIEKDGKYYLYFCDGKYSEGVAVSDNPNGPFRDSIQLPCGGIDPAIFIDDDGQTYYYWGQMRASGVRMNPDMKSFDEASRVDHLVTEEEHGFHEGSSMRKRNGIYYYVYPCIRRNNAPTCLAYSTSTNPLGPFQYGGIIIDNAKCDPKSWNIHGIIAKFRDDWYVVYHRSSGNSKYLRRMCMERILFNEDGSIPEVKMTSIGVGAPFSMDERIEGYRACEVEGGAYTDGTSLVMLVNSEAIIRYVDIDSPAKAEFDKEGDGMIDVFADNVPLADAEFGVREIKLVSRGNVKISNLIFVKAQ